MKATSVAGAIGAVIVLLLGALFLVGWEQQRGSVDYTLSSHFVPVPTDSELSALSGPCGELNTVVIGNSVKNSTAPGIQTKVDGNWVCGYRLVAAKDAPPCSETDLKASVNQLRGSTGHVKLTKFRDGKCTWSFVDEQGDRVYRQ